MLSIYPVNNVNEIEKSRLLLGKVKSTVRNLKYLDIDTKTPSRYIICQDIGPV